MIARHRKMMRHGWSIPQSLEWLFWPIGYQIPRVRIITDEGPDEVYIEQQPHVLIQKSLAGRFKLTNRDAFLAQLRRLGAIREQKS